ncbi:MAG: hypothetical protein H6662_09735 [Ardenticatenaceae bacterium]|nr:hypothetical protein [Ardenticatenaceae bacterium]MCB8990988.1 hypothetical protein [Ardenticatenaceae bacterium]MCB9005332.1 hypothetical protein [Ardenticatenaceae bacterium]
MSAKRITIELPDNIFTELAGVAKAASLPVEEVILQSIRTGMPPTLNKVPTAFHKELLALNKLSDRDLIRVVEGELVPKSADDEQHRKADFVSLRRIYALSLLKWRGHPVPMPYESLVS